MQFNLDKILPVAIFTISSVLIDFAGILPSYYKMKRNKIEAIRWKKKKEEEERKKEKKKKV